MNLQLCSVMKLYTILFGAGLFYNTYCGCSSCRNHKESQSNLKKLKSGSKQKSIVKIIFNKMDKEFVDEANKRCVAALAPGDGADF